MKSHVSFYKITLLISVVLSAAALTGCGRKNLSGEKAITAWICTDANFARFATRDSVDWYLDKIKDTGFNQVCVDVKGADGQVLYHSDFLPTMTEHAGRVIENRGWDYLGYFLEAAHKRDLKVMVSIAPFSVGVACEQFGAVYRNPELKRYTCLKYTPEGMIKLEDDRSEVGVNMNPCLKFTQEYGLRTIREVLTRYPEIDALCLDYCRYPGGQTDFSDSSRVAFEKFLGHGVERFPEDIYIFGPDGEKVPGRYYRQWWTWRGTVIRDFISQVHDLRDSLLPSCKIEYWAASWLHALYANGQNWGSKDVRWYEGQPWAGEDYDRAAFAELLDVFITGTYLERVWDLSDNESIEYGLMRTNRDIAGACGVNGSIYAVNHLDQFDDACYLCLRDTDGLMVFDLCQIVSNNLWDKIKSGINRYYNESE